MRESTMLLKKLAFTHGGVFHADDVFSAALLKLVHPGIKIIRGLKVPKDFEGIVFDIGGGKFDHHQKDAEVRENGIKYAAFGLLWREFGHELGISDDQKERFDKIFVQGIDDCDNGGRHNPMSLMISQMNPTWEEDSGPAATDKRFVEAVEVAKKLLEASINNMLSELRAAEGMKEAIANMTKEGIVILPKFMPWQKYVENTDAMFVVFPSNRGGYGAQVVPVRAGSFEAKKSFPAQWAGLTDKNLEEKSGIIGLNFCHNGRFFIAADTEEAAVEACKKASAT